MCPWYRWLDGPQGQSGRVRKISPPTGIRSPYSPALYPPPPLGLHGLSQGRNFPGLNLGYESSYILTAVTITFRVLPYAVL